MEQIADRASVSKPTVYRFFGDKEALFAEVVLETLDRFGTPFRASLQKLSTSRNVERDLNRVARDYIAMVTQPSVVGLRRLVIGAAYYRRAPDQTLRAVEDALDALNRREHFGSRTCPRRPHTSRCS